MSQFYLNNNASDLPGVDTLTGNDSVVVGASSSNNINLIGAPNGGITVTGNAGTNTESISLTGYSSQTVTTSNNTPNNTMIISLGIVSGVYNFIVNVSAFDATDVAGAGFSLFGTVRTTGLAAILVGIPNKIVSQETAMATSDCNITVSANNMVIQVTGIEDKVIDWKSITSYTFVD